MSIPSRRLAIATVAVAAALTAAWLVPLIAVLVIWPFFLIVPGWALLSAVRPRIDLAGRLGLAIVLSIATSTHLVFWASHLTGGYGRGVIFGVAALLTLPVILASSSGHLPRPPTRRGGSGPGLAVAGLAALVVGLVLALGLWRVTPSGVVSGGWNWSDLGVHLSIAETLNAGANFPPEVPYFSGVALVYHWFADFHAAILALAAGLFSPAAMVLQSSILAGALGLVVFSLVRLLVRGRSARRAAALGAGLAIFGGGIGYLRLIGDLTAGMGSPIDLVRTTSYDNQWLTGWPYFRIPSVMGVGLLAHRATTAGLPILVGAVLLLVAGLPTARQRRAGWRDRRAVIGLSGLLGALLAPFHFFFFPAFGMIAIAWVGAGRRLLDPAAPRNAAALLAPFALAVPFALTAALQARGSGFLQLVTGWALAPLEDGLAAVVFFYLTNLGLPFVLALVTLAAPGLPHRGFLGAWVIGLFAVPNLLQVSAIEFDMSKYFQGMWIGVAILAAWLIRRWPAPAIAAVVAISIPSPFLAAAWTATSDHQVMTIAELRAAQWTAGNTPPDAVFVTDGWVNSFTDAAGRRRLTTFAPYIANLGHRPEERISHVLSIYCGGDAALSAQLMRRHGATYVVDGARPSPCASPVIFDDSPAFELVYDEEPRIWRLAH